jgi:hypothetical protein
VDVEQHRDGGQCQEVTIIIMIIIIIIIMTIIIVITIMPEKNCRPPWVGCGAAP